ncbi:MAG: hypothetical protein ACREUT_12730 [Steroidobacteraceae bacterium]
MSEAMRSGGSSISVPRALLVAVVEVGEFEPQPENSAAARAAQKAPILVAPLEAPEWHSRRAKGPRTGPQRSPNRPGRAPCAAWTCARRAAYPDLIMKVPHVTTVGPQIESLAALGAGAAAVAACAV